LDEKSVAREWKGNNQCIPNVAGYEYFELSANVEQGCAYLYNVEECNENGEKKWPEVKDWQETKVIKGK
jgi:hypothetical protein